METSAKLYADSTRANASSEYVSQLREDWRAARAAHVDLTLMGMPRVNLLLLGAESTIQVVLDLLLTDLRQPVVRWRPGERLALPRVGRTGTIILHDVGGMAYDDQRRLLEWLDRAAGRMQVISTTAESLMPRLESREFIDTLYYRLNTVYLDVTQ